MKYLLLFCVSFLSFQINAISQTNELTTSFVHITGGYGYADQSDIKGFYPADVILNSNHFTFGFQFLYESNKLIRGFSAETVFAPKYENDSTRITQQTVIGDINIGYMLVDKQRFSMFPLIGIGGGASRIQHAYTKDIDFNLLQNNPYTESNFYQYQLIGDIGLVSTLIVGDFSEEENGEQSGISLGVQIGYTYALPISNWKFTGANISDGPDYTLAMPYAKLIFGFRSK